MTLINRNSRIPFKHQLYEILIQKISDGEWKPGDQLPAESELIEKYQVSRNTIRNVLNMLVQKGLIYRERGRGTFISKPRLEQSMVSIINFTEDMKRRGIAASSRVISSELLPAPKDIADKLNISPGEELALLRRLRLGDEKVLGLEESYIVHKHCPGVLTKNDYSKFSLRETIRREYGLKWLRATQVINAVNASKELANLLNINERDALISIERVSYSQEDIPVEFIRIYYRGDRYLLYNELVE